MAACQPPPDARTEGPAHGSTVGDMRITLIASNLMAGVALVVEVEAADEEAALEAAFGEVPDGWKVLNFYCSDV